MDAREKAFQGFGQKFEPMLDGLLKINSSFMQEAFDYGCLGGGKRLRPFLTYMVGRLYEVPEDILLRVGAAVEMVHSYSLIHDDLPAMDNATLRRGRPAAHVVYGQAQAILMGDGLLSRAFEVLVKEEEVSPQVRVSLIQSLARASGPEGMVAGQWLDIDSSHNNVGFDALLERHNLKTGAMIACGCELGALLGGCSSAERGLWKEFGRALGLAFQVADDLLDATGVALQMGKDVHQDSFKTTFVSLLGEMGATAFAHECVQKAHTILSKLHRDTDQNINILHLVADYTITRIT